MANAPIMAGFAGLRVLALESRRAEEMSKLIANYGGEPVVAPSMREVPLESNTQAQSFARGLADGEFDVVIFLTGVGARALARVAEIVYPSAQFIAALKRTVVVARGPKPAAVLREWDVPIAINVPEPHTWREILRAFETYTATARMQGPRVAVQEYGASNVDLLAGLAKCGARVTAVPVYEWDLPTDTGPLRHAIAAMADGQIDVALFTSAMQVNHLFQVADEMKQGAVLRQAFARILVASIGPVTSERLLEYGVVADLEPTHPKMGILVGETAARAAEALTRKRGGAK